MGRYGWNEHRQCQTIKEAFFDLTVNELKSVAKGLQKDLPTRKADLVHMVCDPLEEGKLPQLWQQLTDVERTYLSEVVHSGESSFDLEKFEAKSLS